MKIEEEEEEELKSSGRTWFCFRGNNIPPPERAEWVKIQEKSIIGHEDPAFLDSKSTFEIVT